MSQSASPPSGPTANHTAVEAVVSAVAATEGVAETELPPLYDVLDPDALEAVLDSSAGATVTFTFEGYEVTVDGTGRVDLQP